MHAAYRPEGGYQTWLLAQAADAAARLDHCQILIRAHHDDLMDRAELCWDQDRCRAVEEVAARLAKDPARTASRLRETAQGCRWILARWDALGVPLAENTPWTEDQCNLAATLMGVGSDLRPLHPELSPEASADDQAALFCRQADALHTLMVDGLEPLDAKERELARLGYSLHPSKELNRLQRHETRLRRIFNESLDGFRRLRAEGFTGPEPITCRPPQSEPERIDLVNKPLIVNEIEPELESIEPDTKSVASMPSAVVESIALSSERPASHSFASTLPKPSVPLNRRARRALEAANRKAKARAC